MECWYNFRYRRISGPTRFWLRLIPTRTSTAFISSTPAGFSPVLTERWCPCTPMGCMRLIKSQRPELAGLKAVVVGRSNIVGKPMAMLLLAEHCTVTIAHSKTHDLPAECRAADILVAAVGRPELIRGDWIKRGRDRYRRGHQPDRQRRRQDPPGWRCRVRGGGACRRRDHAGAGRRGTDDGGVPVAKHPDRRLSLAGSRDARPVICACVSCEFGRS